MENILLVLNIVFAIILVLLVLMQKSEGGALGIYQIDLNDASGSDLWSNGR